VTAANLFGEKLRRTVNRSIFRLINEIESIRLPLTWPEIRVKELHALPYISPVVQKSVLNEIKEFFPLRVAAITFYFLLYAIKTLFLQHKNNNESRTSNTGN